MQNKITSQNEQPERRRIRCVSANLANRVFKPLPLPSQGMEAQFIQALAQGFKHMMVVLPVQSPEAIIEKEPVLKLATLTEHFSGIKHILWRQLKNIFTKKCK